MNETTKNILRIIFILSPILLSYALGILSRDESGLQTTATVIFSVIILAPLVAIVGLIVSALGRKKRNSNAYSLWGYAASALLACSVAVLMVL